MLAAPKTVGGVPSRTLSLRFPLFIAAVWIVGVMVPSVSMAQSVTAQATQAKQAVQQQKPTPAEHFKTLLQKAEQGDANAQYQLGMHYTFSANGRLAQKSDSVEAAKWYRKAADQGLAEAQFALGQIYNSGQGVPQDYVESVKWLRKAAEQGHEQAQFQLGVSYEYGEGVQRDYIEAHKWYNIAAARDSRNDAFWEQRDRIAKKMTATQIAEAQKRARKWIEAFQKRQR
jgi:TPR repeat protein